VITLRAYDDAEAGLLDTWGLISDDEKTAALNGGWYRQARRAARKLSAKHGCTLAVAAGVVAALSPRVRWSANINGADHILGGGDAGPGFNRNVEKACRIRDGERPLDVLGGPKVTAFYRAIMGDEEAAVIDVWMWRALGMEPNSVPYEDAKAIVVSAAKAAGVSTTTFQALVWTHVRGGGD
jgi:hypothetical protein